LPWSVVREALRGELERISERQPFLLGGVTFCGLVPQRSIPFRVVCLLGMNEGEFPRRGGDAGLNLMLERPRRGDRDTRCEDRYLFLEALMAARDHLHVSYIGEGVHDGKPRNPASPLAELLQFLDAQYGLDGDAPRPWLVRHPLQPFDARYFERSDPRLFSFDPAFATDAKSAQGATFMDVQAAPPAAPATQEISLAWLKRFWRDPAKALLRDDAGVSLDALDAETWPDREPLKAKADAHDGIERQLLFAALAAGHPLLPPAAPDWLGRSGLLAAGAAGERAYANARARAQAALAAARDFLGDSVPCVRPVELDLDGMRVVGSVDAFRDAHGRVRLFGAKPANVARFNELLPFYFDFAALRLMLPDEVAADYVECKDGKARTPKLLATMLQQDRTQLRAGLQRLACAAVAASASGFLFPPRSAWEWANANTDRRTGAAREQWEGDDFHLGERSYAPGYAALLARGFDFSDVRSPAHARFVEACTLVCGALDPGREVLRREAAKAGKRAR
jgi:exodeoxyribonuclease V gamma subunit